MAARVICVLLFLWRECCHALRKRWRMAATRDTTGRAYLLCSSGLQVRLQLTALTADKSGNIKEIRRAAELRHRYLFSSPTPPFPNSGAFSCSSFAYPRQNCQKGGSDIRRILQKSVARHVNGSLRCVRLPPRLAVIQPLSLHIKIARQEGEEKEI